ncbi:MAG: autotransporter-associated beta strand repeat-containing protein, partial [Kiritimatiellae bacterium]|nr:autotransporter-associated beta strand repeat-containing protein [Kiritimatiellia bacterium]
RVGAGGFMTGPGNFSAGRNTGSCGALYIDGGTFIRNTPSTTGERFVFGGYYNPGYGYLNVSDGFLKTTRFVLGPSHSSSGLGIGVARVSGGTFETKNAFVIGYNAYSLGVLTVDGGTIDHANASTFIQMGYSGGRGELNMIGGALLNDGHVIEMRRSSGNTTSIVNICSGTLSLNAFENKAPGIAWLNLRGGTLRATANTSVFFPTTLKAVYSFGAEGDFAGGAVIDTDGFDIAFAKPVSAPSGNGVYAVTLTDGGSGYIGEPYVSITGGGGFGVAAVANMEDDGTGNGTYRVASVTITAPGCDYTSTPTVAFLRGGNGVTEPTVAGVTLAPNVSGGLTKAGAGTLTLNAVNTYQGATKVSGGTILLTNAQALPTGTDVVLDGGTLDLNGYTVTNGVSGSGTLANGTLQATVSPAGEGVIGSDTFTLDGATVQGLYVADVTADGASDLVTFQSGVDLDGWTLQLVDPQLLNRQHAYTVMSCAGGRVGKLTVANLPDSRWHVVYGGNGIVMLKFVDGTLISIK